MILDTPITIYSTRKDNIGKLGTFADFIRMGIAHKKEIEQARMNGTTQALKELLPCATISGVFEPTRAIANLKNHSGLICIDIDHVEPTEILSKLAQMDCIAYASRSVSGAGVYAVVKVKNPSQHAKHYAALCRDLSAMGIEVDKQCKDVSRLRFVSYDADAILRPDAVEYAGIYEEPRTISRPQTFRRSAHYADRTLEHVARCCELIAQYHVDITNSYNDWRDVGFSLASLGESGREFFHIVSSQCSAKYNHEETDRKFTKLLQAVSRISIATFFERCHDHGITYKQQ